jgi:hypothetical protein
VAVTVVRVAANISAPIIAAVCYGCGRERVQSRGSKSGLLGPPWGVCVNSGQHYAGDGAPRVSRRQMSEAIENGEVELYTTPVGSGFRVRR